MALVTCIINHVIDNHSCWVQQATWYLVDIDFDMSKGG